DDAFAEVNGPGQVAARPFVVLADIQQREFFTGVQPLFHFPKIQFLHASFCIIHDGQKSRRMFHENLPERRSVAEIQINIKKSEAASRRSCRSAMAHAKKSACADKITSPSTPVICSQGHSISN